MEDYDSVANFDVYFYAAAKKCEASDERQFAQYKKAMSASLKKSILTDNNVDCGIISLNMVRFTPQEVSSLESGSSSQGSETRVTENWLIEGWLIGG